MKRQSIIFKDFTVLYNPANKKTTLVMYIKGRI